MKKIFHILNPSGQNRKWVEFSFQKAKPGHLWSFVTRSHPHHVETLLEWGLREKIERFVVWGGDGTFHRVIRYLVEKKMIDRVELGLVPLGTCNDLARYYKLTKEMWQEWDLDAPSGRLASLSLLRVSYRLSAKGKEFKDKDIFINNAGFGRSKGTYEKKQNPWQVLNSFSSIPLTAKWSDGQLQGIYYMVLGCNAPYFSGGLHFEKNISPEDEKIRFYFIPVRSKWRLGIQLFRGRSGNALFDTKTTKVTTDKLVIETKSPVFPQMDGEPPPPFDVHFMEFEVLTKKVKLWVPDDSVKEKFIRK